MQVNWAEVTTFGNVDPGEYKCLFADYKFDKSAAGNSKVILMFAVDDDANEFHGQRVPPLHKALTATALWSLKLVMIAMGRTEESLNEDDRTLEEQLEELKGNAHVMCTVEETTFEKNGQTQHGVNTTNVRAYLPWGN